MACDGPPARSKEWRHAPAAAGSTSAVGAASERARERADAEAKRAHTLRVRLEAEPTTLNPLAGPDTGPSRETLAIVQDNVFESLIRIDPATGAAEPMLAASFEILNDGKTLRFFLREGVTFHDKTPLTADDIKFSLDAARGKRSRDPHLADALASVYSVDVWTPKEVRVELLRPDAYVLPALAEAPILPAHAYARDLLHNASNRAPVGTGPYRFASWKKGDRIALERSEAYWGAPAKIDDVEFVIEPDGARALLEAKDGDLDIIPALARVHWPNQASAPGIADAFQVVRFAPPSLDLLVINPKHPPFDDPRARQALALLVDRARIAREVHGGLARPIGAPIWPGGPGDGPAPAIPPFDPGQAMAILESLGWHDADGDGVREREKLLPDNTKLVEKLHATLLSTAEDEQNRTGEADVLTSDLRKAGFLVEPKPIDEAAALRALDKGEFDVALVEWRGRTGEDLSRLVSLGGDPPKDLADTLAQLRQAYDPQARVAELADLAGLLETEWPIVPIVARDPHGLVARRVEGFVAEGGWFRLRGLSLKP